MHNRRRPALPPVSTTVMLGNHAAYAHAYSELAARVVACLGWGLWAAVLGAGNEEARLSYLVAFPDPHT